MMMMMIMMKMVMMMKRKRRRIMRMNAVMEATIMLIMRMKRLFCPS